MTMLVSLPIKNTSMPRVIIKIAITLLLMLKLYHLEDFYEQLNDHSSVPSSLIIESRSGEFKETYRSLHNL